MIAIGKYYSNPKALWREYLGDPVRLFIIFGAAFALAYGTRKGTNSPFESEPLNRLVGDSFSIVDVVIIAIGFLELIRRFAINDLGFDRTRITRPYLAVLLTVGIIPLFRMFAHEELFRMPLELMYLPAGIGTFFIWRIVFRREELPMMIWLVIAAGIFKAIEGYVVFQQNGQGWGTLTGWRDAMLTTMMLMGGFFAFIIKPEGDKAYRMMRIFLLVQLPLTIWVVITSMRRSYMLAAVIAIPILFVAFRKSERRAAIGMFVVIIGLATLSVLMSGADAFNERFAAVAEPTTDGSTAYRLLENYNMTQMILERPIVGWPMAVKMKNYTTIDFELVSSLIPHNIYLYALMRGGLIGLAAYMWLISTMIAINYRTIRHARTPMERFCAFWLTGSTILAILTGISTPLYSDRLQYFLPFLILMSCYLPGAWPAPRKKKVIVEPAPDGLDFTPAAPTS